MLYCCVEVFTEFSHHNVSCRSGTGMEFHLARFHSFCYPVIVINIYTVLLYCVYTVLCDTYLPCIGRGCLKYVQCLLNFHYDVGCQGLEIDPCIKFCLPQFFSLSHTYANPKVLTETVFCCFGEMRC